MRLLYSIVLCGVTVLTYPFALLAALFGRRALLDRIVGVQPLAPPAGGRRVWIHAASVGESVIALAMARCIRQHLPGAEIVISTVTATGLARVRNESNGVSGSPVTLSLLAPVDCPLVAARFVDAVAPTAFILVETELWPSLIGAVRRRGVPVTVINGRLSRRAFRRYSMVRGFMRDVLAGVSLVCVQSRKYSGRFNRLGVPWENIEVTGNVKFDSLPDPADHSRGDIRREFGLPPNVPVFVAGSTRPGEEEVLARAWKDVTAAVHGAVMVVCPRHMNRVDEVERMFSEAGLSVVRRSGGATLSDAGAGILLLDTMGELVQAFAAADVAFVGGSLRDFGGHNPMEPAALGIPVVIGQYMDQVGSKELLAGGAAMLVHDAPELTGRILELFGDDARRRAMSAAGIAVIDRYRGSIERTVSAMRERGVI